MTLRNPNIERMLHLGLTGMIEALEDIEESHTRKHLRHRF